MKRTKLRDAITSFSSESLNAIATVMMMGAVAAQAPAKPINLKPEVAAQLKTFTDSYMARGLTRFSCGYGRWGVRAATKEEYHPTINLVCDVLRQLPRMESQKLLHTIGESVNDNVISADEQKTIRTILTENKITINCDAFREALGAIPDTKKDNPHEIDPKRVAGKTIAPSGGGLRKSTGSGSRLPWINQQTGT